MRILIVNVHFAPVSFGGATIVAEHLARELKHTLGQDILIYTSSCAGGIPSYRLHRYQVEGIDVVAVRLPHDLTEIKSYNDPDAKAPFREVVKAFGPDVVHFHAIQGLSATLTEVCREFATPYIVTVHDAWWLCERQFMVDKTERFCGQKIINLLRCALCVKNVAESQQRSSYLRAALSDADIIVAPSENYAGLYQDNGFTPSRIVAVKNGVLPPSERFQRAGATSKREHRTGPIRLGYVGGRNTLKGYFDVWDALIAIDNPNYKLVMVDSEQKLGKFRMSKDIWDVKGAVTIVEPYDADSIDNFFVSIDVLLFPSKCRESFGLTVREALLRDVWVIATDSGGAAEDIRNGVNGDIIAAGDVDQLRAKILEKIEHPEKYTNHVNWHKSDIQTVLQNAQCMLGLYHSVWSARQVIEDTKEMRQVVNESSASAVVSFSAGNRGCAKDLTIQSTDDPAPAGQVRHLEGRRKAGGKHQPAKHLETVMNRRQVKRPASA